MPTPAAPTASRSSRPSSPTLLACAVAMGLSLASRAEAAQDMLLAANDNSSFATTLPAVTVTADKIERPLEKVPASVAVLDGEELEQNGIDRMEQLEGRLPGLSFQPFGQAGMTSPSMRGLTAAVHSFSTSVLMMVDGVPTLTPQGFDNDFLDIDRVELLRGPQSTLYGRNAEAGVLAIYSKPMDNERRAAVSLDLGSRDKRLTRFALSSPLVDDTLYASVSGSWLDQDGFVRNTWQGGHDDQRKHRDLNLGLRWTPHEDTDIVLRYTRQDYDDGAMLWGAVGTPRRKVSSGSDSWNDSLGQTLSLNITQALGDDLKLHSITAYNRFDDKVRQDTDFTPVDLLQIGRDHQLRTWSQEFRLEGQLGRSDWLLGLYADHSDNDLHNYTKMRGIETNLLANTQNDTLALFSNWNIPLDERWTLSAGARVERTWARLKPDGDSQQEEDWTNVLPKLALQYQLSDAHQWYASVSRGVRAGGFNIYATALDYPAYAPEKAWSYETGLKGWMLDQRLRYSLALYYMDIDNMQVMMQPQPQVNYIASAATATSRGVELDADYLLGDGWQIKAGVALNRTRFDSFVDGSNSYDGKHNPFAPDLTGHLSLRYDAPQGWYAQAGLVGSSKVYLDAANRYERNGYGLVNLLAGYQFEQWEIAGYANNIADQRYDAVGYQGGYVTVYSPPRELGVRLTWRL